MLRKNSVTWSKKMITAGIDIGSLSSNSVIMNDDEIVSWVVERTGPDSIEAANRVMTGALTKANLEFEDIEYIVSTGYGRVVVPFANKKAERHFKNVIEVAEEKGAKIVTGGAYLSLGLLHKAKKRKAQAKEFISKAVKLFEQCEADVYIKQANEALESL